MKYIHKSRLQNLKFRCVIDGRDNNENEVSLFFISSWWIQCNCVMTHATIRFWTSMRDPGLQTRMQNCEIDGQTIRTVESCHLVLSSILSYDGTLRSVACSWHESESVGRSFRSLLKGDAGDNIPVPMNRSSHNYEYSTAPLIAHPL